MDDRGFQDAPSKLCADHEGSVTLTTAGLPARPSRQREELIRDARRAAQRAVRERGLECQTQREAPRNGWRNMWIALVVIGVILLFVRLQF
jgi:hypothetical protein